MAFTKTLKARGTEGSYMRPVAWRMDDNAQEASVLFALFVDREHSDRCKATVPMAEREQPLLDTVAKLRVAGHRYEELFGAQPRKAAAQRSVDVVGLFYDAAKTVCERRRIVGKDDPHAHVISDFGGDLFADAANA